MLASMISSSKARRVPRKSDRSDRIYIQGVDTDDLSFRQVSNIQTPTGTFSGISIYASGYLEAIFTGGDLTKAQLQSMTVGVDA